MKVKNGPVPGFNQSAMVGADRSIFIAIWLFFGLSSIFGCSSRLEKPTDVGCLPATSTNWTVRVCSGTGPSVSVQAGTEEDNKVFYTWYQGAPTPHVPLCGQYQGLPKVVVQVNPQVSDAVPEPKTETCLFYRGNQVQAFHQTDGSAEKHEVDSDHSEDDCKCL